MIRGFAVTEVSTFFTMPKRKTIRRKQRGGGLKEDALATLKEHGIKTDNASLEHFAGTIGLGKIVKKVTIHIYIIQMELVKVHRINSFHGKRAITRILN